MTACSRHATLAPGCVVCRALDGLIEGRYDSSLDVILDTVNERLMWLDTLSVVAPDTEFDEEPELAATVEEGYRNEIEKLRTRLDLSQVEATRLQRWLSESRDTTKSLRDKLSAVEAERAQLAERLDALANQPAIEPAELKELRAEVRRLRTAATQVKQVTEKAERKVETIARKRDEFEWTAIERAQEIRALHERISDLEDDDREMRFMQAALTAVVMHVLWPELELMSEDEWKLRVQSLAELKNELVSAIEAEPEADVVPRGQLLLKMLETIFLNAPVPKAAQNIAQDVEIRIGPSRPKKTTSARKSARKRK